MRRLGTALVPGLALVRTGFLLAALSAAPVVHADEAPTPETPPPSRNAEDSPLRLFAAVEEAWLASDADRLADLVDTTTVRITLEPGSPPTSAITHNAALFLFRDQLRLVKTLSFQVTRLEISRKAKPAATATALWSADWGGRRGVRDLKVTLAAAPAGNRWVLTEVRAND